MALTYLQTPPLRRIRLCVPVDDGSTLSQLMRSPDRSLFAVRPPGVTIPLVLNAGPRSGLDVVVVARRMLLRSPRRSSFALRPPGLTIPLVLDVFIAVDGIVPLEESPVVSESGSDCAPSFGTWRLSGGGWGVSSPGWLSSICPRTAGSGSSGTARLAPRRARAGTKLLLRTFWPLQLCLSSRPPQRYGQWSRKAHYGFQPTWHWSLRPYWIISSGCCIPNLLGRNWALLIRRCIGLGRSPDAVKLPPLDVVVLWSSFVRLGF